jgi:hypothetical protein
MDADLSDTPEPDLYERIKIVYTWDLRRTVEE